MASARGRLHRVGDREHPTGRRRPRRPATAVRAALLGRARRHRELRRGPSPTSRSSSRAPADDARRGRRPCHGRRGPLALAKSSTGGSAPARPRGAARWRGRPGALRRPRRRRPAAAPRARPRRRRAPTSVSRHPPGGHGARSCRARRCRPDGWTPAPPGPG